MQDVALVDDQVKTTGCPTNAFAVAGERLTVGGVLTPGDGDGELSPHAPSRRAMMAAELRQILEDIVAPRGQPRGRVVWRRQHILSRHHLVRSIFVWVPR